ncbi:MAG: Crp/Fnr family transcriptional regulator [Rudaea sp.]
MENISSGPSDSGVHFSTTFAQDLTRTGCTFEVRRYANGEVIFSEGNPCAGLYVVKLGRVKLLRSSDDKQQLLALAAPGDPLDLVPLLDGGPHTCAAKARGPIELFFLDSASARELVWNNPDLLMAVMHAVGDRLRDLCNQVTSLAFKDVKSRVCEWLLQMAEHEGRQEPDGIHFERVLSQRELAAHIGTGREVVWRALKKLEDDKVISVDGNDIVVLEPERLAALV